MFVASPLDATTFLDIPTGPKDVIYSFLNTTSNQSCFDIKFLKLKCFDFQLIDYTSNRGGVSVLTNKAETTVSSLNIQKARVEDGGSYSCKTNNVEPASIKVHVLTG